jgi:hypothetical protein
VTTTNDANHLQWLSLVFDNDWKILKNENLQQDNLIKELEHECVKKKERKQTSGSNKMDGRNRGI